MSSSYSNLKFELIGTGEQSGIWGASTNVNIGTAIEQALVGMATLTSGNFTANVATLILTDTSAAQNARAFCLNIAAGAVSAAGTINVPAIQKPYIIINGSSYTITVKVSGLTGVAVPAGKRTVVYNNGTDVGQMFDYMPALQSSFTGNLTGNADTVTNGVYLATAQTLTNKVYQASKEVKTAIAASNIDLSLGNYYSKTISGTTTFTVSNVPTTGTASAFVLELTNGGSATVNWWAGVKWAYGAAPVLTLSGVDVLAFYTFDGGTTWRGFLLAKDSK